MAQLGRVEQQHRPHQFRERGGKAPGDSPKHRAKTQQQQTRGKRR